MRAPGLALFLFALTACCPARSVRVPVVVSPPPCLTELAPRPPVGTDAPTAWARYHVRLEAFVARVEASCGAHLMTEEQP